MLFSYHLLYFCTALSLIIMLSSHYHHHKSKTFSQLTQCPFTGTLLLFDPGGTNSNLPVERSLPVEKSGPCLDQATGNAVEEMQTATQPLGAPSAGIATQHVQAPGSFPEVQPTGEEDLSAASDSEADQLSVTGSRDGDVYRDRSADRDASRDEPDSEPTEEANYRNHEGCEKLYELAQGS